MIPGKVRFLRIDDKQVAVHDLARRFVDDIRHKFFRQRRDGLQVHLRVQRQGAVGFPVEMDGHAGDDHAMRLGDHLGAQTAASLFCDNNAPGNLHRGIQPTVIQAAAVPFDV